MFIEGNISLRVRKPFGAVVATSGEVLGLISKNCDSDDAFAEARCFGFSLASSWRLFTAPPKAPACELGGAFGGAANDVINTPSMLDNKGLKTQRPCNPRPACSQSRFAPQSGSRQSTGWTPISIKAELQVR
jgi:hypothetical protein